MATKPQPKYLLQHGDSNDPVEVSPEMFNLFATMTSVLHRTINASGDVTDLSGHLQGDPSKPIKLYIRYR